MISLLLFSCTGIVERGEISTIESDFGTIPDSTFSPESTQEETTKTTGEKIEPTETSDHSNTEVTTNASFETVDINNPKLSDLFDIEQSRKEAEVWVSELLLTPDWFHYSTDPDLYEWKWKVSFNEVIDIIGKPHGFRPGHPDTLVWITDTGNYYAIRFEIDEDTDATYINAYDQFIHSFAAFYHPVLSEEISTPDHYSMDDLPIKECSWNFDPNIPLKDQFFDFELTYFPSDDYLNEIFTRGISLYDIVSYIGKPHGYVKTSGNNICQLFWVSDTGKKYLLRFNIYFSPGAITPDLESLILEFCDSVNNGSHPTLFN